MTITKSILITGASGFIGSALVAEALGRGYEVWAGVRGSSSREYLKDERIRFIDLNYSDEGVLTAELARFKEEHGAWQYVIHNAGVTKAIHTADFFRVNAEHTRCLLQALATSGCTPEKFLLMSSLSTYGKGDEQSFRPIRLDDPQQPDTIYGKSKLQAEKYVREQDHFPYIILRPTGVFGPRDKDYFVEVQSIRSGLDFAVGYQKQQLTFIYVEDLASVALLALEKKSVRNRHYFVGDGEVTTDEAFARMIQEILGRKRVLHARIPMWMAYVACQCSEWIGKIQGKAMTLNTDKYHILKQRNWICDVAPLQDELGFRPAFTFRERLQQTIDWYIANRWL